MGWPVGFEDCVDCVVGLAEDIAVGRTEGNALGADVAGSGETPIPKRVAVNSNKSNHRIPLRRLAPTANPNRLGLGNPNFNL